MNKRFKKKFCVFILTSLVFFVSCEKNANNENVTIVRDCTGTYIRYQEKDYQVCNINIISQYVEGQVIKATFNKINSCNNPEVTGAIICMMYHENEGWVEITSVN